MLMGETAVSWPDLRRFVQGKDFISMIVSYDSSLVTSALRDKVCGNGEG